MKIGIIGAGIAGLATAARLASKGHEVHVFEANSYAGGKLSAFILTVSGDEKRAYRFDAGPSLFTMPQYIEDLFAAAKVPMNDYFAYETMPDVCHYFWQDGTALTAWADADKFAKEVHKKLNINELVVKKTLASAKRKYDLTGVIFLENSLHKVKTWLTAKVLKSLILMPTFDIFKTMNATHERLAEGNPKFVQLLNRFATYNGSNPYRASGMLSVIPHFEHGIGCFYPVGGMNNITKAVFNLAKAKGVQFHFNALVNEIIIKNKKAVGLKIALHNANNNVNNELHNANYIVNNKLDNANYIVNNELHNANDNVNNELHNANDNVNNALHNANNNVNNELDNANYIVNNKLDNANYIVNNKLDNANYIVNNELHNANNNVNNALHNANNNVNNELHNANNNVNNELHNANYNVNDANRNENAQNTEGSFFALNDGVSLSHPVISKYESDLQTPNFKHQTEHFDRIVSNMDVYFTYKKLLPNEKHPERTLNQERSTSALIFYWGVKQSFPQLGLHNIFFSDDYKTEFDVLDKGDVGNDPTIYVNITSKLTPSDAPEGCENWFVLINVPHNEGQDWATITARTRQIVIQKMGIALNVDFQSLIEVEDILDPLSIEAKTASFGGALYGTSSNALMSAFMRHPNFSSSVDGLYFVGGSVHPGGGIPLALLSAKIVDENFK